MAPIGRTRQLEIELEMLNKLHVGELDSGSRSNWAFLAGHDTQFPFCCRREEEGPVEAGVINNDDLPLLLQYDEAAASP